MSENKKLKKDSLEYVMASMYITDIYRYANRLRKRIKYSDHYNLSPDKLIKYKKELKETVNKIKETNKKIKDIFE